MSPTPSTLRQSFTAQALLAVLMWSAAPPAAQSALKLQSAVVVVEQADGEGVISMQNQGDAPILLYAEIVNVPEDTEDLLMASPPIARVDANETQAVRLILKEGVTLVTERYKRVTFEGIPQTAPDRLQMTVRQNLPVIIRPGSLPPNEEPWKLLKWHATAERITVANTGPYVVRLSAQVSTQPQDIVLRLPRNYILPGETLTLTGSDGLAGVTAISFRPASLAGYLLEARLAPVIPAAARVDSSVSGVSGTTATVDAPASTVAPVP